MPSALSGGTIRLTANGLVGPSGAHIKIISVHLHADGVGAATMTLRNGTGAGDEERYFQNTAAINVSSTIDLEGMTFPAGCFFVAAANVDYASITFYVVNS